MKHYYFTHVIVVFYVCKETVALLFYLHIDGTDLVKRTSFYILCAPASGARLAALATTTYPTSSVHTAQEVNRVKVKASINAPKPRSSLPLETFPRLTIPRKPHFCRFPKILADFYENLR